MLPALSAVIVASASGGGLNFRLDCRSGYIVSDGTPSAGDLLQAWTNLVPGGAPASQTDSALQPTLRSSIAAGLLAPEFTAQKHMGMTAADADVFIVAILDLPSTLSGGERVLLARDTSATTTKPAYSLAVVAT